MILCRFCLTAVKDGMCPTCGKVSAFETFNDDVTEEEDE